MKNSEKVAELLIKHGADVMATDSSDETPLHYTAVHDAEELADLLIRNGADVDAKNSFGRTPLIYAIAFGNMMEVAEMLIENGANVNIQDDIGETPLKWAKWKNKQKLVELLERHMEHE
ncbi:uncharacterized protein LOC116348332 [Contarinia nasturtii]|uniref:uncharacterized protein LOC116348332 n=1 Tax=Contarinia nasturtii TaxID=265458 RepID=UPI0012D3D36A|nr:uncharacterized protein LOC116348332 [Contarinia nasturtii]